MSFQAPRDWCSPPVAAKAAPGSVTKLLSYFLVYDFLQGHKPAMIARVEIWRVVNHHGIIDERDSLSRSLRGRSSGSQLPLPPHVEGEIDGSIPENQWILKYKKNRSKGGKAASSVYDNPLQKVLQRSAVAKSGTSGFTRAKEADFSPSEIVIL